MNALITPEQVVLIKARDEALFLECNEGVGFAGSDRRALLRDREAIAAELEQIRDALKTIRLGTKKKDHKQRAWEYEVVIANTESDLGGLLSAIRGEK